MLCAAGWIGKDVVTGVVGNGANKVLSSSASVWTITALYVVNFFFIVDHFCDPIAFFTHTEAG